MLCVQIFVMNFNKKKKKKMPVGLLVGLVSVIPEDLWVKRLGKDYIGPFKPPKVCKSVCMSSIYDTSRHR
jgi:thiamine transporter ThiT